MPRDWVRRLDNYFLSFLRRVFRWSPAYKGVRLEASRPDKKFYCRQCKNFFLRSETCVDHIKPVVPIEGWDHSWDHLKQRMSFEDPANLQVLCRGCHQQKTNAENKERRAWKRKNASRQD